MSWARIDDHANEHRKQLRAGPEACWLWTCGLMYCNRQAARDGIIPDEVLGLLYPSESFKIKPAKLAAKLVEVGLWERVNGGFRVHNWERWNRSSDAVEAERAKGRKRARRSFERRKAEEAAVSSGEEKPKTDRRASEEPGDSSPQLREVFAVSSGSTPLHSKKIRSGRQDPRPDTSGARDASAALPASEPPDVRIPCPPDLTLSDEQIDQLEMAAIPRDLVPLAIAELRSRWVGDGSTRTPVDWNRYLRKSVTSELSDGANRRRYRERLRDDDAAKPDPPRHRTAADVLAEMG